MCIKTVSIKLSSKLARRKLLSNISLSNRPLQVLPSSKTIKLFATCPHEIYLESTSIKPYQAISSHVELSVGMAVWLRGFRLWIGMKRIDVPLVRKGFIIHDISWLWHITYHDDILNTYYDFEKELLQKKNVGLRGCLLAHRHIHTQTHLAVY